MNMSNDPFLDEIIAELPALRVYGRSLCGDQARADDYVQDTVLKAWINKTQLRPCSNLRAWLFVILRNCYYSDMRRRKFEVEDPAGALSTLRAAVSRCDSELHVRDVCRALQRLPAAQREALLMVHAAGVPYREAADACGVAVGTIKSRIARARHQLVEWLGEDAAQLGKLDANWFLVQEKPAATAKSTM